MLQNDDQNLNDVNPLLRAEYDFTQDDFDQIQKKIHTLCGIVLRPEKKSMVYARLIKRLKALSLNSFKEYLHYLKHNESTELTHLINTLTTNLTKFFRENHHFEHLSNVVLEEFSAQNQYNSMPKFRVWSCAASSGEEPYSIAFTLYKKLVEKKVSLQNVKVLATDIDTQMIAHGDAGVYSAHEMENVPEYFKKHFNKQNNDEWSVAENIKKLITFKQLNLIDKFPFSGPFDAVFCRNVVIYFDKDTQRVLFDKIANVLKPNGWLYIGHSESLFRVTDRFELIGQTIYRKVY
ncbi:MAG: protein-glutamate O-methyltransferase [Proteobacteria bacterium]|nr:protein-glutamate O-methyltransferase [Pseudomonadota bacterium]